MAELVLAIWAVYSVFSTLPQLMNPVKSQQKTPDPQNILKKERDEENKSESSDESTKWEEEQDELKEKQNEKKESFDLSQGIPNPSLDWFMIASLQCFLQLFEFWTHFYNKDKDGKIDEDEGIEYSCNIISDKCKVSKEVIKIIDDYYKKNEQLSLKQFRPLYDKEFSRESQHDALQFILSLFENIQSEINGDKVYFPSSGYKDGEEAWRQYQNTHTTVIDNLFVGMYESTFKCMGWSDEVKVYEEFKTVSLYCDQSDPEAGFKEFLDHPESIEPSQMMCKKCQSIQDCQISKKIVKYPKYMILAFQRLDPINQTKINGKMQYEEEFIRYCPLVKKDLKYKINSAVIHQGEVNYGHYTAICKRGNKWVYFNDSHFKEASRIIHDNAYILFYETDDINAI